jgi:TPR repeat protein
MYACFPASSDTSAVLRLLRQDYLWRLLLPAPAEEQTAGREERAEADASNMCFCREPFPRSEKEALVRLRKKAEGKDANALLSIAISYGYGNHGLPVDQAKCIDLLRESADLGCAAAQYELENFHNFGQMSLQQNKREALKYWERAAEGGNLMATHNLGCDYSSNGDLVAAMRYWRSSASGGYRRSMYNLIADFGLGLLHHCDLAESLRAFYRSRDEMKSEGRDQYIAHLKRTGEYEAEYGM